MGQPGPEGHTVDTMTHSNTIYPGHTILLSVVFFFPIVTHTSLSCIVSAGFCGTLSPDICCNASTTHICTSGVLSDGALNLDAFRVPVFVCL